jgi:hypothetical protein
LQTLFEELVRILDEIDKIMWKNNLKNK